MSIVMYIYGLLPKTFIKTLEQYFNHFFLCGQVKALGKGGTKYLGKKFTFPREKKYWHKSNTSGIFTQKLGLFGLPGFVKV